jgi:tRNA uridine 5-carbamoylmethylation protein Kti12
MVGLPASGKTYIAKSIQESCIIKNIKHACVSMDVVKSKPKMIKHIKQSAVNENTIIVDNTNLDVQTRSEIIKIVKSIDDEYFVRIIYVNTSLERCIHNNYYRYHKNYKTDHKLVPDFVYKMMVNKFVEPSMKENTMIDAIETVTAGSPADLSYMWYFY